MSDYRPSKGDRVRVVLEGEVTSTHRGGDSFVVGAFGEANEIAASAEHVISIEKLEPPVTVFKPGDTVRNKKLHEFIYTVAENGYYDHYAACVFTDGEESFTSETYELILFAEVPF